MSNTERYLLSLAQDGITPLGAVRKRYPQSQQPLKKAKTFAAYLEEMERKGLVRNLPEYGIGRFTTRYILTPHGRSIGRSPQVAHALYVFPRIVLN